MGKGAQQALAILISDLDTKLRTFSVDVNSLSLRDKVLRLVEINSNCRALGIQVAVDAGLSQTAARDRIEAYLVRHVGLVIDKDELAVISGITEFGKRTRELRTEKGFRILTGASNDPDSDVDLRPDQYLLVTTEPDREAAHRWLIANRLRKEKGGMKPRLLKFFQANVGKIVSAEELAYVAKPKKGESFTRRIRELRSEEGYAIATKKSGRPDLNIGEYILLSPDRISEPHDRHIPAQVQQAVYARDNNRCRLDGWGIEKWTSNDPRILELHHLKPHVERGENILKNLIVLCSRCHDEVHAGRLKIPPEAYP